MIITNNEDILRAKCEDVLPNEINSLIQKLELELSNANRLGKGGIGLASPQINIHKKVAIIRLGGEFNFNLVNCKIKNAYNLSLFKEEGCLSFPNERLDTMRYQEIHIVDNLVYPHSFIATGLVAVAIQHELDHINSILFKDRAIPKSIIQPNQQLKKKPGPNDKCFCGSNKKYKKCCKA